METLIVHIGPHKTGSTAIQMMLHEHRPALASAGMHYPEIGFHYYGHHTLQEALNKPSAAPIEAMARALNALEGTVILSSENFSRSGKDAVRALAERLDFRTVRVIYYQRNFLDLVYVFWQELVKHGSTQPLLGYVAGCLARPYSQHLLNAPKLLNRWAEAFGREAIEIYLYDQLDNTAAHFFGDVLGLRHVAIGRESLKVNKSFDVPSTELIRCLNQCGLRGVEVLMKDERAKELREKLRHAIDGRTETLKIGYDCFIFNRLEVELRDQWGGRIIGHDGKGTLFEKRSRTLEFIDSPFWFAAEDLASEVRGFAAGLASRERVS